MAKKKKTTKTRKSKKANDAGEITPLDPEVEAFAKWFADWWLRRGRRLVNAAKKADPNYLKRPKRTEDGPSWRWDEETERFVLDRDTGSSD